MRVLVIEDHEQKSAAAVETLRQAGHEVTYCHEPTDGALECNGMPGRVGCPLEDGNVDVAMLGRSLDVGRDDRRVPSAREAGAGCAKRHRVPVVITGTLGAVDPPSWAADILAAEDPDLVERIDAAARQGRVPLVEAAEGAARAALERAGRGAPVVAARVIREHGRLRVSVDVAAELDDRVRDRIAVRVVGAVREIDRSAPSIDVQVLDSAPR